MYIYIYIYIHIYTCDIRTTRATAEMGRTRTRGGGDRRAGERIAEIGRGGSEDSNNITNQSRHRTHDTYICIRTHNICTVCIHIRYVATQRHKHTDAPKEFAAAVGCAAAGTALSSPFNYVRSP